MAYAQVRKIRDFAQIFAGHALHPDLLSLRRSDQSSTWHVAVTGIVYRDRKTQFGDVSKAAKDNYDYHKRQTWKAAADGGQVASIEGTMLAGEVANFMRAVADDDPSVVFSLPSVDGVRLFDSLDSFWSRAAGHDAPADDGGDHLALADGAQEQTFFSVLLARPSAIKRPRQAPSTRSRFTQHDVLVTVAANHGSQDAPVVPVASGSGQTRKFLHNLPSACTWELLADCRRWSKQGGLQYTMRMPDGAVDQDLSEMLHDMVNCGGLPEVDGNYKAIAADQPLLNQLAEHGYVEQVDGGWKLTHEGAVAIGYRHALSSPVPFSQPRPLPLEDMTAFELMATLHADGWTWSLLPKTMAARNELRFSLIAEGDPSPRIWYTAGTTVSRAYLLCLTRGPSLFDEFAIEWIPHHASEKAYLKILEGIEPIRAIADNPIKRGAKRPLQALALDVDHGELPALEDGVIGEIVAIEDGIAVEGGEQGGMIRSVGIPSGVQVEVREGATSKLQAFRRRWQDQILAESRPLCSATGLQLRWQHLLILSRRAWRHHYRHHYCRHRHRWQVLLIAWQRPVLLEAMQRRAGFCHGPLSISLERDRRLMVRSRRDAGFTFGTRRPAASG